MKPLALLVTVLLLLAIGVGRAGGSFTAEFNPLSLNLEILVEHEVHVIDGWREYVGTGFAVEPWNVTRFDPYTLWCRELDVFIAFSEACIELRVPVVDGGDDSWLRTFLTIVW